MCTLLSPEQQMCDPISLLKNRCGLQVWKRQGDKWLAPTTKTDAEGADVAKLVADLADSKALASVVDFDDHMENPANDFSVDDA